MEICRGQVYQLAGGVRTTVLASVLDDEMLDPPFVILRREGSGDDHTLTVVDFLAQRPELITSH